MKTDLHKLETAIRQKWNEIDDQTIEKAIFAVEKRLAAVTKQDGD